MIEYSEIEGIGSMRYRLWVGLMLLMLAATACNLGSSSNISEEPLATDPPVTGKPSLRINAPDNNSEFVVDEQIFVQISATDSVGVTRAQLIADGQLVRTISSESLSGDTDFEGVLDFTPRTTGEFRLQVLAFRGSVASDPAEITVTVREEQSDIVVTTRPDTNQPVIPNDGVCRALTNVGLNFRSEPTTERDNIITVLASGTLAPIVARLGDNSWWKLSHNNRVGWVSADFTTIYGNCSAIPVESFSLYTPTPTATYTPIYTPTPTITNTPLPSVTPGTPDLIVASISGDETLTIASGASDVMEEFAVTITNLGQGPSGQFSVIMRVDTDDYDLGVISNLERGESIVLTQEITFDAVGSYDIRVDVDPDDDVDEISEVNNRGDKTIVVEAG